MTVVIQSVGLSVPHQGRECARKMQFLNLVIVLWHWEPLCRSLMHSFNCTQSHPDSPRRAGHPPLEASVSVGNLGYWDFPKETFKSLWELPAHCPEWPRNSPYPWNRFICFNSVSCWSHKCLLGLKKAVFSVDCSYWHEWGQSKSVQI